MAVIRTARAAEGKFVQIANAALQDRRLTAAARGILAFVLSLPPDRTFTAKWLEQQLPDGREAIRSALRNLEQCGYLQRGRRRDEHGHWVWDQVISDAPLFDVSAGRASDGIPSDGLTCDNAISAGRASDGIPSDGMPSHKELKTVEANTKDLKTENAAGEPNGSQPGTASHPPHPPTPRAPLAPPAETGDWRDDLDPLSRPAS